MSGIIGQDPTGRSGIVNQFSTLGVGKSPLATLSSEALLQIGGTSMLRSQTAVGASKSLSLGQNAYLAPDDSWDYISGSADEATLYAQQNGTHVWYVAGSGTGNISFTTAQTISNSGDVYSTPWTVRSSGDLNTVGFSSLSSEYVAYKRIGLMVFFYLSIFGVSNANTFSFTMPYTSRNDRPQGFNHAAWTWNNGALSTSSSNYIRATQNTTTITLLHGGSVTGWATSNAKGSESCGFYELESI